MHGPTQRAAASSGVVGFRNVMPTHHSVHPNPSVSVDDAVSGTPRAIHGAMRGTIQWPEECDVKPATPRVYASPPLILIYLIPDTDMHPDPSSVSVSVSVSVGTTSTFTDELELYEGGYVSSTRCATEPNEGCQRQRQRKSDVHLAERRAQRERYTVDRTRKGGAFPQSLGMESRKAAIVPTRPLAR
ncbi:hypothetical protein JB92DRAFT_2828704 [Gautieria morchelliformis]|nr:hypothetical protein JB92DRAFT_2828704 [Gautieria morchelliformis]